jgi:hypothetical protein
MADLRIFVDTFLDLLEQGDYLMAIDRFYDDKIIQVENGGDPLHGKARLRDQEKANLDNVHSVEIQITNVVVDEEQGLVWGEMVIHFDSKKSGRKKLSEAFMQHWRDGLIVRQQFYYKGFQDDD